MSKKNFTIIGLCVVAFLFINFLGGLVIHTAGQTALQVALGYLYYAIWGLIFGLVVIFIDWAMGRKKR
jgi:hypothetical protein